MTDRIRIGSAIAALAAAPLFLAPQAGAAARFTEGHGDIEFAAHHHDDHDHDHGGEPDHAEFEAGWHIGEAGDPGIVNGVPIVDEHYEADELMAVIGNNTRQARPAGTAFDFLGVPAGAPIWVAPQTDEPGKVFLGIGLEDLHADDWLNGEIELTLDGVSGPGEFSLYQTDSFGGPIVKLDEAGDSFFLPVGTHTHYFWAFTQTGLYTVNLTFSGTFSEDGFATSEAVSASAGFGFAVVPSPTAAMGAVPALALLLARRRR